MFETLMRAAVISAVLSGALVIFQIILVWCAKKRFTAKRLVRIGLNTIFTFYFATCINVTLLCALSYWGEYSEQKDKLVLFDEITCVSEDLFKNNQEILKKLSRENYMAMDLKKRQDALYQLAQLESIWLLGEKTPDLQFKFRKINTEHLGGYYDHAARMIVADLDCADQYEYMLELVAHEMWHMYEFKLLEGAEQVNEKVPEKNIQDYRRELAPSAYISIEDDLEGYEQQTCEKDAYAYGERAGNLYLNYINRNFT